jgi:hypothetical protein
VTLGANREQTRLCFSLGERGLRQSQVRFIRLRIPARKFARVLLRPEEYGLYSIVMNDICALKRAPPDIWLKAHVSVFIANEKEQVFFQVAQNACHVPDLKASSLCNS